MSFGNNRLLDAMRRVEEYRRQNAALQAQIPESIRRQVAGQQVFLGPPVPANMPPPPPVPPQMPAGVPPSIATLANPALYPSLPSATQVQAQLQDAARLFAQNIPGISQQTAPYMTPGQMERLAQHYKEGATPEEALAREHILKDTVPVYQQQAQQALMTDLAGQAADLTQVAQQQQQDYEAMLPAAQAEQTRQTGFDPSALLTEEQRRQWEIQTASPAPPEMTQGEFAQAMGNVGVETLPQVPSELPQLQEEQAALSTEIAEADLAGAVAQAESIVQGQSQQEWNEVTLNVDQQLADYRHTSAQVRLAIEKGDAPAFYDIELPDGGTVQVTPDEYVTYLDETIANYEEVINVRENLRYLGFMGVPMPSDNPSLLSVALAPLALVGELSDWPRRAIGRPIFGTALYLMAAAGQQIAGDFGDSQDIIDTWEEDGATGVWEEHIAGAADNMPGITRLLSHAVINLIADPLTYLSLGTIAGARQASRAARAAAQAEKVAGLINEGEAADVIIRSIAKPGTIPDEIAAALRSGTALTDAQMNILLQEKTGLSRDIIDLIFRGTTPQQIGETIGAWRLPELQAIAEKAANRSGLWNAADAITSIPGLAVLRGGKEALRAGNWALNQLPGNLAGSSRQALESLAREGVQQLVPAAYRGLPNIRPEALADQPGLAAELADLGSVQNRRILLAQLPEDTRFSLVTNSQALRTELDLGNATLKPATGLTDLGDDRVALAIAPAKRVKAGPENMLKLEDAQAAVDDLKLQVRDAPNRQMKRALEADLRVAQSDLRTLKAGGEVAITGPKRITARPQRVIVYNRVTDDIEIVEYPSLGRGIKREPTVIKTMAADEWLEEDALRGVLAENLPRMTQGLAGQESRSLVNTWAKRLQDRAIKEADLGSEKPFSFVQVRGDADTAPVGYTNVRMDTEKGIRVVQSLEDNSLSVDVYKGAGKWERLQTVSIDELAGPERLIAGDMDPLFTGVRSNADNFTNALRDISAAAWQNVYNRVKNTPARYLLDYGGGAKKAEHKVHELLYGSQIIKATQGEIGTDAMPQWVLRESAPTRGEVPQTVDRFLEEWAFLGKPDWELARSRQIALKAAIGDDDWGAKIPAVKFKESAPEMHREMLEEMARAGRKLKEITPAKFAAETGESVERLWYRWATTLDEGTIGDALMADKWVTRRAFDKARIQIAEGYLGRELTFGEMQDLYRHNGIKQVVDKARLPTDELLERGSPEIAAEQAIEQQVKNIARVTPSNAEVGTPIPPEAQPVVQPEDVPMGRARDRVTSFARENLGYKQGTTLDSVPISNRKFLPRSSYDIAWYLHNRGAIDDIEMDAARTLVKSPDGETREVMDLLVDHFDAGSTVDEAIADIIKQMGIGAGREYRRPLRKIWDSMIGVFRDSIMYSIFRGPAPGIVDATSDSIMMCVTGHCDAGAAALRDIARSTKAFGKAFANKQTRAQARELMLKPLNDHNKAFADSVGITVRERYTHAHALRMGENIIQDTQLFVDEGGDAEELARKRLELFQTEPERLARKAGQKIGGDKGADIGGKIASTTMASGTARAARTMIDDTKRSLLFSTEYVRYHEQAVDELIARARNLAPSLGMTPTQIEDMIRQIPADRWANLDSGTRAIMDQYYPGFRTMTPEDLLNGLGGKGAAKDLARFWRGQVRRLQSTAEKSTDEIMFSYLPMKLDTWVQQFVFFHYWMSRALGLQLKIYLSNPIVSATMYRMFEGLQREMERNPETPWYLNWTSKVLTSPYGMAAMVSPVMMLVPFAVALDADAAMRGEDKKTWDRITSFAMVNPAVQAAAAMAGFSDEVPDITATGAFRRQVIAGMNLMKAYGLMPAELGDNYDPTDDAIFDKVTELINYGRDKLGREPIRKPSRGDYDRRRISHYMATIMQERGIDPQSAEADAYWGDFISGAHSSDIYQEAYRRFAKDLALGQTLKAFIPVQTAFQPTLDINYQASQGSANLREGIPITPEQDDALFLRDMGATGSPEAGQLQILLNQRDRIGTANIRETYKAYNDFAYNDLEELTDEYGADATVTIDPSTVFTLTEWTAMPEVQRQMYLDQWLVNIGESREMHAYVMARKDFEAKNPLLAEYAQYQQEVGKLSEGEGGVDSVATTLSRQSPGFGAWMEGENDWEDFDINRAIYSPDAFLAQKGIRPTIYDVIPDQGFDPGSLSGIQGMTGGTGGGEEFFTKPFDEQTTDEKVDTIITAMRNYQLDMTRYEEQVAALLPPGQNPAIWGAPGTPWYEATIGKLLKQANIQQPSMPAILSAYQLWIGQAISSGVDPTPMNYVVWYESVFGPSPLASPTSTAESAPTLQPAAP